MDREVRFHLRHELVVRHQKRATKSIGEKLAAKIVDEVLLAVVSNVSAQTLEAGALLSARKLGAGVDRTCTEIEAAAFADRTEALENETEGIETCVTARAR